MMNAERGASCKYIGIMSGVVGNRFGRMNSFSSVCVSSVKYSSSSFFVSRQAKYEYDCVKPTFASICIMGGRVNASAKNNVSG